MATISSHILNTVDGTHAGGIAAVLCRLNAGGEKCVLFTAQTDSGGRLKEDIDLSDAKEGDKYELVFSVGNYWSERMDRNIAPAIVEEVVLRFTMPDPGKAYHLPIMLSPSNYSVWWSG